MLPATTKFADQFSWYTDPDPPATTNWRQVLGHADPICALAGCIAGIIYWRTAGRQSLTAALGSLRSRFVILVEVAYQWSQFRHGPAIGRPYMLLRLLRRQVTDISRLRTVESTGRHQEGHPALVGRQ
jgi:hypothetical protein